MEASAETMNLIRSNLGQLWSSTEAAIRSAIDRQIILGDGRGELRRELCISSDRLRALRRRVRLEETLERTIVAVMPESRWFNQFNPGAGIGGTHVNIRKAADILRVGSAGDGLLLDFFELKEWQNPKNSPEAAALEVFEYAAWWLLLYQRRVAPYDAWRVLQSSPRVRLWLLAPEAYFEQYGGIARTEALLAQLQRAAVSIADDPLFCDVRAIEFQPSPVVLEKTVTRTGFPEFFDPISVDGLIGCDRSAKSPLELIRPDRLGELRSWIKGAFRRVGLD